ncbi:MAG: NADH-quinone oxidoreductase subunit J family protein, partial [Gemmatimonadales bacterium]
MSTEVVFYILAVVAVLSALGCIVQRNPVTSALFLVNTMFALAAIYVLLRAQFIAAIQVLVYAGAVMVLFLFVIMLLNIGRGESDLRGKPAWIVALLVAVGLVAELSLLHAVTPGGLAALGGMPAAAATPADAFPG